MSLQLTTAPTVLAVSLAEAKLHLRVDGTDEDTLITALIGAACESAEQHTGRALLPQAWTLTLDAFPALIQLTRVPVTAVTSIKYDDLDGVEQTLAPADYTLSTGGDYGVATIVPTYAKAWPSTRAQPGAVRVVFAAGYANAAAVPESIKAWIKLQVGAMFDNRAAEGPVQTHALGFADRLLDRYRVYTC